MLYIPYAINKIGIISTRPLNNLRDIGFIFLPRLPITILTGVKTVKYKAGDFVKRAPPRKNPEIMDIVAGATSIWLSAAIARWNNWVNAWPKRNAMLSKKT